MREEKNNKELLGDEVLHNVALNCMKKESSALDEMINSKPHVFSEEFERKMQEVMRVETPAERAARLRKKRVQKIQIVATIIVTVVLAAGLMFQGNRNVLASDMKMRITQWLENAFVREEGEAIRQERVEFEKEQIGYLPEGFNLVSEEVTFTELYYKFGDSKENYIILKVDKSKATLGVDNNQVMQDIYINSAGLEYQFVVYEDSQVKGLLWTGKDKLVYTLHGTVEVDELIKIMDGIVYKGE